MKTYLLPEELRNELVQYLNTVPLVRACIPALLSLEEAKINNNKGEKNNE